jgi:NDP-sugar pyrophosphorylase family protein
VVSTGIYSLQGSALDLVLSGQRLDMPELLTGLMAEGRTVHCLLSDCEWKDLGRPEDFASLHGHDANND